jgi:hypothetical protein
MISHKHKCIFIHIPKVAGQSIETSFLNDLNLNWENRRPLLLMHNSEPTIGPPRLAHLLAKDYVNYNYISKELFNDYYKFAFVRNPYSRAYSFYKYLKFSDSMSFDDFILKKFKGKYLKKKYWFLRPQYDYIYSNGKCLIDFVGRFENLEHDFKQVASKFNLDQKLLRKNISKLTLFSNKKYFFKCKNLYFNPSFSRKLHNREFEFSENSKQILIDFYANDFKYFKYDSNSVSPTN